MIDKVAKGIVKLIAKQFKLDKVLKYVEEDNELDKKVLDLDKRLFKVEKIAHPRRDFVVCNYCKNKIKEYEGTD
jgi:hypothetical protein